LLRQVGIDHPVDAEFVEHYPEARVPKCVLERHLDLAALGELVENALRPCEIVRCERQRDIAALLVLFRTSVGRRAQHDPLSA
jgi:hypothetical protein